MRRIAGALVRWTGWLIVAITVLVIAVAGSLIYTAAGRARVRDVAVRVAERYLAGTLHIGTLQFSPGCAFTIDSVVLRGTDDSVLVATGPLSARCDAASLVRGRLVLRELHVTRPVVLVRQLVGGGTNWSRALRPRPPRRGPSKPRTGSALAVAVLHARDGTLLVRNRQRVVTSHWTGIQLDALDARVAAPDADVTFRATRIAGRSDQPPIVIHDARGGLRVAHDSALFTLPYVVFGRSTGRAEGSVTWHGAQPTRLDIRGDADTVAFADLAWTDSIMPDVGGGRGHARMRMWMDTTEWAFHRLDATTAGSHVRGDARVRVANGALLIDTAALDLLPLQLTLVERITKTPTPFEITGDLTGRLVAHGGPRRYVYVDTAVVKLRDTRVPGSVTPLSATGIVDFGDSAAIRVHGLRVASDNADARTVVKSFPYLPPLAGRVAFVTTMDSTFEDLYLSDTRIAYRDGPAPPLVMRVAGRVVTRTPIMYLDGTMRLEPLSFGALERAVPSVRGVPAMTGDVTARGPLDALALRFALDGAAGSFAWDGRVNAFGPSYAATGALRVEKLDLRALVNDTTLPHTRLAFDANVTTRGSDAASLAGTFDARIDTGRVGDGGGSVALLPSHARVRIEPGRYVVDSATLHAPFGDVRAHGALGRLPTRSDTLTVVAHTDSLDRVLAVAGGTTGGVTGASVTIALQLVGNVDTLAATGTADVAALGVPPATIPRGHASLSIVGLPSAPTGRVALALDSVVVADVPLGGIVGEAAAERPGAWSVAARTTSPGPEPGFALVGAVARTPTAAGTEWAVSVDSLDVRTYASGLRLERPAHAILDPLGGIALDTVELHGRRGSRFRLAGRLAADGVVDAMLSARQVPLGALLLERGWMDTTVLAAMPRTVTADARLTGTRTAPIATFQAALRGTATDSALIDSVTFGANYGSERAKIVASVFGVDRPLLALDADVPARVTLSPAAGEVLDAPMRGRIDIDSLSLRSIGRHVPAMPFVAGDARAHVTIGGTGQHPQLTGDARLHGGAFSEEALGFTLDSLEVDVAFAGDTVRFRRASVHGASGRLGDGNASLAGWIGVRELSNPTFDLRMTAHRMPVIALQRRADVQVDADLRLTGAYDTATVGGSATIARGVLKLPELGSRTVVGTDDTAFVRLVDSLTTMGRGGKRATAAPSPLEGLAVRELALRMGDDVWLRSSEANLNLGGAVRVSRLPARLTGDTARLEALGELRTLRGSYTLDLGVIKRTFDLESGTLRFQGGNALDPQLDVSAMYVLRADPTLSRTQDVRIRVRLRGTVQRPTLTLANAGSTAEGAAMTQEELLSYLVTGRPAFQVGEGEAYKELARNEITASVATSIASRLNSGGLFDVVTITPGVTDDASAGVLEQTGSALKHSRFGVGKKLNDRTFLTVDAGGCALSGSTSQVSFSESLGLSLDYQFRPDLTFRLKSEPSTSATLCANSLQRGFAVTPRQWGFDLLRHWRF